jgi:hypothetical protein
MRSSINLLEPMRRHHRRGVPSLMSMLAVVWLGMVLQPCLMAAEMSAEMAAEMPAHMSMPANAEMPAHIGMPAHMEMPADMDDCPHCPVPMQQDCGAGACTYVDRVDYDGRTTYVKIAIQHLDDGAVLAGAAPVLERPKDACTTGPPTATADIPTPPLNMLFCVYLI